MPIPSMMNHSAPLSASSTKNGISGRDGHGPESGAEVSSFGNLLAQEMGERETSAGPESPGDASDIDRPPARDADADLPDEPAGTTGMNGSGGDASGASENVEKAGTAADIAALVGMAIDGAKGQATLPDPKADSSGDLRADTGALLADQRVVDTPDTMASSLPAPEQRSEFAIAQPGRAGAAAAGPVSSAASPAWNMRQVTMEAGVREAAASAGTAEAAATAGTSQVETGRVFTGLVVADSAHATIAARGGQSGKPIRVDMADPGAVASRMEPGLRESALMEAVPGTGLNPGLAAEEGLAANPAAVQTSLAPAVERSFAVSAENAVAPDLPGIEPRIGAAGWDQALGQKVLWLLSQQQQVAELNLNPPELGPLQVVLKMADDQLSATFVSQQADVRNALEAALPRLKEMMSESGINLSSTTVSADSSQQQGRFERPNHSHHAPAGGGYQGVDGRGRGLTGGLGGDSVRAGRGIVDTFA